MTIDMNTLTKKTYVLLIGPGQTDVGGVATFIEFMLESSYLNQKFAIIHMDTARGLKNQATAGRFSFRNLLYLFRQIFTLFTILVNRHPQIIHLNVTAGWSFWKTSAFMFLSQAFHAKVIAHIHGGAFKEFIEASGPTKHKLIGMVLGHANGVVVLSQWWKEYIQTVVGQPLRITVIPNAPEESYFREWGMSNAIEGREGNTILFVGSIGRRKGIFDILNAIPLVTREWDSASFVFLGEEEIAGEKQQVLQVCRELNLSKYVHFLGWVTGDEKRNHYQRADIFTLPSHAENLPFSLLEAMAMGLPVVTTPVGGIPEVVEEGRSGYLIQPGNEQELAERILRLLKNPLLREELGRNARLRMQENYSPEKIAQQWELLYFELLPQHDNKSQHLTAPA